MGKHKGCVGRMGYQGQRQPGDLLMCTWHDFVPWWDATHRPGKCSLVISVIFVRDRSMRNFNPTLSCSWHKVLSQECVRACVHVLGMPVDLWNLKAHSSDMFPSATPHLLSLPKWSQQVGGPSIQSPNIWQGYLTQTTIPPNARAFFSLMFMGVLPYIYIYIHTHTEARRGCWIV